MTSSIKNIELQVVFGNVAR